MKHLARIVMVVWTVGAGLGMSWDTAQGEVRPGWYVGMSHGPILMVDPTTQRELVGSDSGTDLALSSDGNTLVVVTNDQLGVVDAHTLVTRSYELAGRLSFSRVALSPDGTHAAIGTSRGEISFYDLAHEQFLPAVSLGDVLIGDVTYSPDGRYVYATTATTSATPAPSGAVVIIDATGRQIVGHIELPPDARRMAMSADGSVAYVAAGLSLWQVDLVQRRTVRSWYAGAPVADVALSRDERHAYIVFGNVHGSVLGTIELDRDALVSTQQLAGCSEPNRIALAADGRSLAITLERFSALIFVDIESGAVSALATDAVPRAVVPVDLARVASEPSQLLEAIPADELFACGTTITIESATGSPGETIDVAVRMDSEPSIDVAGIQTHLIFDPQVLVLDTEHRCRIDPAIGFDHACDEDPQSGPCKELYSNIRPCTVERDCPEDLVEWTTIRTLLLSLQNVNPIPPGVAYRCRFMIRDDAAPGTSTALRCKEPGASTPHGDGLPIVCRDGSISITTDGQLPAPTPTNNVPTIDLPLEDGDSSATAVNAGGCQTAPAHGPLCLLLLLPPLLILTVRRRQSSLKRSRSRR